jgi:hypothetical protein
MHCVHGAVHICAGLLQIVSLYKANLCSVKLHRYATLTLTRHYIFAQLCLNIMQNIITAPNHLACFKNGTFAFG